MKFEPINSEKESEKMLEWVDGTFDEIPTESFKDRAELQSTLFFIKNYEDEHYEIPLPQLNLLFK